MVRTNSQGQIKYMKKILYSFIITLFFTSNLSANTNNEELYKKIDLFAEVLDKIK